MRRLTRFLVISLVCIASPRAEEPPPGQGSGQGAAEAAGGPPATKGSLLLAWPGVRGHVVLSSGTSVEGLILSRGPDEDVVRLSDGGEVRLRKDRVVGVAGGSVPLLRGVEIVLRDGRRLSGRVTGGDASRLVLALEEGGVATVEAADVREASLARPQPRGPLDLPADPLRTRHVSVPSAFMPAAGEMALGLAEFVSPAVSLGLADYLSVEASAFLNPAPGSSEHAVALVSGKVGLPLLPWARLAGGVQWQYRDNGQVGTLFAVATVGTPDLHLSLYGGAPPAPMSQKMADFGDLVVAAGGTCHVSRSVALVGEAWRAADEDRWLYAATARYFRRHWAVELGVVGVPGGTPSIAPWVALAYRDFPIDLVRSGP